MTEDPTFTVTIHTGNAAMMTMDDIADAIDGIAARLRTEVVPSGVVRDANGNFVGGYGFEDGR